MLKLLLRENRHWLKTEYLFRFLITMVVFGCVLLLILGITLGAPYALIFVERGIIESEIEKVNNSEIKTERDSFIEIAKRVNKKVENISVENYDPSFFVTSVIAIQPDGIGISSINYNVSKNIVEGDKEKMDKANLEVKGVALNRTILVNFQKELQNQKLFETVNIPFSSFTENSDLPFTITIKTVDLIEFFKEKENDKK